MGVVGSTDRSARDCRIGPTGVAYRSWRTFTAVIRGATEAQAPLGYGPDLLGPACSPREVPNCSVSQPPNRLPLGPGPDCSPREVPNCSAPQPPNRLPMGERRIPEAAEPVARTHNCDSRGNRSPNPAGLRTRLTRTSLFGTTTTEHRFYGRVLPPVLRPAGCRGRHSPTGQAVSRPVSTAKIVRNRHMIDTIRC